MEDDNEGEGLAKAAKRKGGRKGILANKAFILFAVALIVGIFIGAYAQHTIVENYLFEGKAKDYNSLLEKNMQLDKTVDKYYKCIIDRNIDAGEC